MPCSLLKRGLYWYTLNKSFFSRSSRCGFISRWKLNKKSPDSSKKPSKKNTGETKFVQQEMLSPNSAPTPSSVGSTSTCSSVNSSPYASPRLQEFPVYTKPVQVLERSTIVLPPIKNLIEFAKSKQT